MNIKSYIGINYNGCHDSNITYFTNKIECTLDEERFSRIKKDGRPPRLALQYFNSKYTYDLKNTKYVCAMLPKEESKKLWEKEGLGKVFGIIEEKIDCILNYIHEINTDPIYVSHQNAHAASAYFTSGFQQKSLVVVVDAGNYSDPYSVSIYRGENGKLELLEQSTDSMIAQGYLLITAILGFKPMHHEGKITGLASYGKYNENIIKDLENLFKDPELPHQLTTWINFGDRINPPQLITTENINVVSWLIEKYSKEDIAFAIQYLTENKVLNLISKYLKEYSYICLAGGVFANVTLNRKIKDQDNVKSIFVHPAMGDDGLSLGAILYAKSINENGLLPFELDNIFLGSEYESQDLCALFKKYNLNYNYFSKIEPVIAEALNSGKIVARYNGRMDYGPRALGDRSLLCRADDKEINSLLNKKLNRTEFMPFAPVVLDKRAKELFLDFEKGEYASRFMTLSFNCSEKMKKIAPAAVHVDNTARPQVLSREFNTSYYDILDSYDQLTKGNSILINTSFNIHGEPIVSTPEEAILSYIQSGIDYLAINNYLVCQR